MERDSSTWWTKAILTGRVKGGKQEETGTVGYEMVRPYISKQGRGEIGRGGVEYFEHEWLIYHQVAIKACKERKKGGIKL